MTFISSPSDSEDVAYGAVIPLEKCSRLFGAGIKKALSRYVIELVAMRANSQYEGCRTDLLLMRSLKAPIASRSSRSGWNCFIGAILTSATTKARNDT